MTGECTIEILPRGSHLEAAFTPKPPPIPWCQRDTISPCDGIRMDGARDDPSICQAKCHYKQAEIGTYAGLSRTSLIHWTYSYTMSRPDWSTFMISRLFIQI